MRTVVMCAPYVCLRVTNPRKWLALLGAAVVVAVLDHLAAIVESEHRHSRVGELLASLGPAGPPLDRSPIARHDRLSESAFDLVLGPELFVEIPAHVSKTDKRLAERR
jgi:hypothetical protein